jgi:hypothetical protein
MRGGVTTTTLHCIGPSQQRTLHCAQDGSATSSVSSGMHSTVTWMRPGCRHHSIDSFLDLYNEYFLKQLNNIGDSILHRDYTIQYPNPYSTL